jgi:hypothetical protein
MSIGMLLSQETTTWVAALQVLIQTQKTLPFSPCILPSHFTIGNPVEKVRICEAIWSIATTMGWDKRFGCNYSLLQGASFLGLPIGVLAVNNAQGASSSFRRNPVGQ